MAYTPPKLLFNAHLETIAPAIFRKVRFIPPQHQRITTPDHDFLDVDWYRQTSKQLVIISHGLEGNSQKPYVTGMASAFYRRGFDVLAWNYRGCSGEVNRTLRFYHSGATDDLEEVITHALRHDYDTVTLLGFSLGGNITLKYLGEKGTHLPAAIKTAIAISVPLHLHSSCLQLSEGVNMIYSRRFLKNLKKKVRRKAKKMPDLISLSGLDQCKTLMAFDDAYTAPIHGFNSALDYYEKCSSLYFLPDISIPTLILNAKNDPFLSAQCYPQSILKDHPFITLEAPNHGGHVGFSTFNKEKLYWSERRALDFTLAHSIAGQ